jgi:hypothetical protein
MEKTIAHPLLGEASDQRRTAKPLSKEWGFARLGACRPDYGKREGGPVGKRAPGDLRFQPASGGSGIPFPPPSPSSLFLNKLPLPAVRLRCTIRVAYQAADAGPPGNGESKLAAELASPAEQVILSLAAPGSGCAGQRLTWEGHHLRKVPAASHPSEPAD